MEYYANVMDLSEIPRAIFELTLVDWFDGEHIIRGKDRFDDLWIKIKGDEETAAARAEVLRKFKQVRGGGGVRIKKIKRKRR